MNLKKEWGKKRMVFDVITVGSATRDIFVDASFLKSKENYSCLVHGQKFEMPQPLIETGGGATNTAVGFARLGLKTGIIAKIGNDSAGFTVKHTLHEEGVNTENIVRDSHTGTALALIFMKKNADRTVFVYRGASDDLQEKDVRLHAKTRWLYIGALGKHAVRILKPLLILAQKKKIQIALNPGAAELQMPELLKYIDVLILNHEEAEIMTGIKGESSVLIQKLGEKGPKKVVITDGMNAIVGYDHEKMYRVQPFDVKIESTLGAGDAFAAGFMTAVIKGLDMKESLKRGCLNAASVIQFTGAKTGLLRKNTISFFERSLRQKFEVV